MWIGVDDTDSPEGGCTTWVLSEILRETSGYELVGEPRLVRLNPNVPFKTRGNAALSARWGRGRGPRRCIGEVKGERLWSHAKGSPLSVADQQAIFQVALRVVQREARWSSPRTDPAIVGVQRRLPPALYWHAMDRILDPAAVLDMVNEWPGSQAVAYRSLQGIVGAAAAIAWPDRHRTWELISYRPRSCWDDPQRRVDAASVQRVADRYPETFQSYDAGTRRVLISPHTPCPILWGLRARRPDRLARAAREIRGETPDRWVLFRTNQATGDHLPPRTLEQAVPGSSGRYDVHVTKAPRILAGGHVVLPVADGTARLETVAFAPTRTLPRVARQLRPGDRLKVWGARPVDAPTPTLHLEGIQVLVAPRAFQKTGNPPCPSCGERTHSSGRGKGYRCRECGARLPPEAALGTWRRRDALRGSYHPTPSARRHLAPLPGQPWARRSPALI